MPKLKELLDRKIASPFLYRVAPPAGVGGADAWLERNSQEVRQMLTALD